MLMSIASVQNTLTLTPEWLQNTPFYGRLGGAAHLQLNFFLCSSEH